MHHASLCIILSLSAAAGSSLGTGKTARGMMRREISRHQVKNNESSTRTSSSSDKYEAQQIGIDAAGRIKKESEKHVNEGTNERTHEAHLQQREKGSHTMNHHDEHITQEAGENLHAGPFGNFCAGQQPRIKWRASSGKCLHLTGGGNAGNLSLQSCSTAAGVKWTFDDSTERITSATHGTCLDVYRQPSNSIKTHGCHDHPNQKWSFTRVTGSTDFLVMSKDPALAGLCMSFGSKAEMKNCSSSDASQKWRAYTTYQW